MTGHAGLPNNFLFRLSLGTIKYAALPFLGQRRTVIDLLVHSMFFIAGVAFLRSRHYELKYIRALCACDVWIFLSDMSQFYASTGHAYFSMLLSACFPPHNGRLAGMQLALLMQWFFSGIGKFGPWFSYVNGPFMLQSKLLAGQRWLFDILIKSPRDLSPSALGTCFAHSAAAVEYLAPVALMLPHNASIWLGLIGIVAMHVYILTMPAPFDVYSWNACFGLSAIYLFYYSSFGFDREGAKKMHRGLAVFLMCEFVLCWYGQFFPDQVGYYLSHRYWAGNWVQTFFFVRNTESARQKLDLVKTFSVNPLNIMQSDWKAFAEKIVYSSIAYLWLGNFNMKAAVRLIRDALRATGGPGASILNYTFFMLPSYACGEFRDPLYIVPLLHVFQQQIGFDEGECFMVRLGAFGMFRETATWNIYDLKRGLISEGLLTRDALFEMDSLPSKSLSVNVTL